MRRPLKITSRSSTITNAFVQAILPTVAPDTAGRAAVLKHFGQSEANLRCVCCGDPASDWDHLVPLVAGKRPSGHTSGRGNMVPACGRCNQSKSGHSWRKWITGSAANSPATRGVADVAQRIAALESFERAFAHTSFDFRKAVAPELWDEYWRRHDEIQTLLKEAQRLAGRIKASYPVASTEGPES